MSWLVGVGFYADGRAGEIFIDGVKSGSQLEGLVDDSAVLISMLLQSGWSPADLAKKLGGDEEKPASLFGLLLHQVAELERDAIEGITAAIKAAEGRDAAQAAMRDGGSTEDEEGGGQPTT